MVVSANAGKKVMPGRTGFFTERCDIDVDNIELKLLSGQGRVEDGVLEYTPDNAKGRNLSMIALPDGRLWFFAEGVTYLSDDEGQTMTEVTGFTDARPTTMVMLPDGSYLHIKNCIDAYRSTDGCVTWEKVGELPRDPNSKYAQPGDRINMIKLDNGVYRVFHTIGRQSNVGDKSGISETYYSDDYGYTWVQSKNSPMEYTNLDYFCETQIIKTKDGDRHEQLLCMDRNNRKQRPDFKRSAFFRGNGKVCKVRHRFCGAQRQGHERFCAVSQ